MSIVIIDQPHPVADSFYVQSLEAMVERLKVTGLIRTIYQIGGVSSPGISDLDMVVVFKHGASTAQNFLSGLNAEERYLFIHNLYGISEDHFAAAEKFAFYNRYQLLWGEDVQTNIRLPESDIEAMKIQIALEYMLKMYITIQVQHSYRVLRMRDILLHVKALDYDLEFLGITSGPVKGWVNRVMEWRKNWFSAAPSHIELIHWWEGFFHDFNVLLVDILNKNRFYLPSQESYRIAKNISLLPSESHVSTMRNGFILPAVFTFLGKKYFRLQNRLNQFQIQFPVKSTHIPDVLEKRFQFEQTIVDYNKHFLPHFLPITSSLHAVQAKPNPEKFVN